MGGNLNDVGRSALIGAAGGAAGGVLGAVGGVALGAAGTAVGAGGGAGGAAAGTAAPTTTSLVGGALSGALSVAGATATDQEKRDAARAAQSAAKQTASAKTAEDISEAARANAEISEQMVGTRIEAAQQRGVVHNLQSRSDIQIASLSREIDRAETRAIGAATLRAKGVGSQFRVQQQTIRSNLKTSLRQNKLPSNLSLGINIAAAGI